MNDKEQSRKKNLKIDKEADFRAGGYHNTYSHEFENAQKKEGKPKEKKSVKELSENLKDIQNETVHKPSNTSKINKKDDEIPTNKNYGWKEGFDRSESYGSELKKNPEVHTSKNLKDESKH